jgi:tRNA threonylcarbamoyladenosine biosynthesis protein TsaE
MAEVRIAKSALEMREIGKGFSNLWSAGDIVLFRGELGAGKTTLVRGILEGLGYSGAVRSPTYNLIQTYSTSVEVMHADLYRVASASGIGLEEYFETHLCLVEWPERLNGLVDEETAWQIRIIVDEDDRKVFIDPPLASIEPDRI